MQTIADYDRIWFFIIFMIIIINYIVKIFNHNFIFCKNISMNLVRDKSYLNDYLDREREIF